MLTPDEVQQVTQIAKVVATQTPSTHSLIISHWLEVAMFLSILLNAFTIALYLNHKRWHKTNDPMRV